MENYNQPQSSTDQSVEQSVVPQPTPNKSKLRLVSIVVLFIVLIPIGAYLLGSKNTNQQKQVTIIPTTSQKPPSPTIDPISNWKIYTNTKVGFQIKYPPDYNKPQIPSGIGPEIAYATEEEDKTTIIFPGPFGRSYSLTVFPFIGSLDDLLKERNIKYAKPNLQIPVLFPDSPDDRENSTLIDKKTAYWYKINNNITEIHFITRDHGFIIRVGEYAPVNQNELNQILSTFKFTN